MQAWIAAERGRFVLWLPVFMAAGVAGYFSLRFEPAWWVGAGILAAGGVAAWLTRAGWAVVVMGLGVMSAQGATWRAAEVLEVPTKATFVEGRVRAVEALPRGLRVTLEGARLDGGEVLGRAVRVRLRPGDAVLVKTGDVLRVRALLSRPAPPAYPGGWDLQRDAFFAGFGAFGYALNPAELVDEHASSGFVRGLQGLREVIARRVSAALSGSAGAIAGTLLTGGTAAIPEADRAAFRDSGLAHLLAIAGLHIGIVMGLIFGAVRRGLSLFEYVALRWPTKSIAAVTALMVGGGYMLLTGAHVPIVRSFLMAAMVTLGVVVGRRALSLRGLALAMTGVIVLMPNEVMGVSFQMSFSAVLALIVGYAALRPWLTRLHGDGIWWRKLAGHVVALGLTSALAGTFSAPFAAYHFGHVQLYYVFANMLAVPLTAMWVMPLGLIALALMPLGLEWLPLVPMGWGIEAILWIGQSVSAWPSAVMAVPHIPAWGLAVLAVGLAWAGIWRTGLRWFGWGAVAVGILSAWLASPPDMLVSAEGRLIAWRGDEGVMVQKVSGASRFTMDAWLQYWGVREARTVACAEGCTLSRNGLVALVGGAARCDVAVLLSAEPIRLRCPEGVAAVDRFSVWRNGAYAIWLRPEGAVVLSDRADRGDRPWVLGLPTRGRQPAVAGLVPALAEELPAD